MRKKYFTAVLMLGVMVSAPMQAAADPLADWDGFVDLLRSKGIDPATVDWGSIDPMCIGLKTDEDDSAFNHCRYNNALLLHRFNENKVTCEQRAEAAVQQQVKTFTAVDSRGNAVQAVTDFNPTQNPEVTQEAQYDQCMQQSGWPDPNDWTSALSQR